MVSCNAQAWALANFGGTDLGDRRREKRLTKMAAAMADAPDGSLPKQCGKWGDVKAAYRLLNHPEIEPQQLTGVHRQSVRDQARQLPVVLCVQDTTDLDFTHRSAVKGLGKIGDGGGRGFRQHTGLAVSEHGDVLGVLEQKWFVPVEPEEGETRRGRQARWSEPDVWGDIAEGIGPWPAPSRLIHVCDRHGDVFRFVCTCRRLGHGFIVRAMHDRYLSDGERLWEELRSQPPAYIDTVKAGAQRTHVSLAH